MSPGAGANELAAGGVKNFRITGVNTPSTRAANMSEAVVTMKSFGISCNLLGSTCPPTRPPIRFPTEEARNQIPIIWPTYFRGESFVIEDMPTGLRHRSPRAWQK